MDILELKTLVQTKLKSLPYGVSLAEITTMENGWYEITITADKPPLRQWVYYDYLAGIESDLKEQYNLQILLIPILKDNSPMKEDSMKEEFSKDLEELINKYKDYKDYDYQISHCLIEWVQNFMVIAEERNARWQKLLECLQAGNRRMDEKRQKREE